jgi:hypothetical protein
MRFLRDVWREGSGGRVALLSLASSCALALAAVAEAATQAPEYTTGTVAEKVFSPRRVCNGLDPTDGGRTPVKANPVDAWKLLCRVNGHELAVSVSREEWEELQGGDMVKLVRRHGHILGDTSEWRLLGRERHSPTGAAP